VDGMKGRGRARKVGSLPRLLKEDME